MQTKTTKTFTRFALLMAVGVASACSHGSTQNAGANTGMGGAGNGMGGGSAVPGSQEDLVANVGDRIYFDTARNTISADAKSTLDRQSGWLGRYPQNSVQIAGNCDDRGTEEYNLALGSRRANAARDYLVATGVSSSRISTISYGKDRPTAVGADEQSWAQNRNAITSVK